VDKYLRTAATDQATLLDYTLNLQKTKADIEAKGASTAKDYAGANYYNAGGGVGRTSYEVAGFDTDNTPILFNRQTGEMGRKDGKPIQNADFTKKFRGAEDAGVSKREEIAYSQLLQSDEWKAARTQKQRTDLLLKYNLDPAKFGIEAIPGGGWD